LLFPDELRGKLPAEPHGGQYLADDFTYGMEATTLEPLAVLKGHNHRSTSPKIGV